MKPLTPTQWQALARLLVRGDDGCLSDFRRQTWARLLECGLVERDDRGRLRLTEFGGGVAVEASRRRSAMNPARRVHR